MGTTRVLRQGTTRDEPDRLCRFYSHPHIGDLLVKAMPHAEVSSIVDLGAGGGVLSDAASRRWAAAAITTVDIDPACDVAMRERLPHRNRTHYVLDALDPEIMAKVGRAGQFDAAICNPPFKKIEWRAGYERVLSEAGLADCFSTESDVTAEALFLAQNVRLVRRGGAVGLIVPDSFISGKSASSLRNAVVRYHRVRAVIQLPNGSFARTEANSYLLVFDNKLNSEDAISLHRFSLDGGLSPAIMVNPKLAARRLDYDFHVIERNGSAQTLASLEASVFRGTMAAAECKAASRFVFHTSDFAKASDGQFFGPNAAASGPYARAGDILMARVDRSLETKIAIVRAGNFNVSDCTYVVRVDEKHRERVFAALRSEEGRSKIRSASRGVGARHLSKSELLAIPLL